MSRDKLKKLNKELNKVIQSFKKEFQKFQGLLKDEGLEEFFKDLEDINDHLNSIIKIIEQKDLSDQQKITYIQKHLDIAIARHNIIAAIAEEREYLVKPAIKQEFRSYFSYVITALQKIYEILASIASSLKNKTSNAAFTTKQYFTSGFNSLKEKFQSKTEQNDAPKPYTKYDDV